MKYPLFVILILTIASISFGVKLKEKHRWRYMDYQWESEQQKKNAIKSGNYNASACVLIDVDKAQDGRIFVTLVRDKGVPASLTTVSNKRGPGGPLLVPYPNWAWNSKRDCNGIISVYRVSIKCNYLFVLDCGKIGDDAVCPPKLLIFYLKNDMLVQRIIIPPDIANNKNGTGLLVTPLAYVRDCRYIDDVTVFMADIEGYGLAMYNQYSGFCRIESDFMNATDPVFTIEGQSFYYNDGILGLTIIDRYLYHASLAGHRIFKIDMRNLRKCAKLTKNKVNKLTQLVSTLSGQTGPIASARNAIFFSNIPKTAIMCMDTTKKLNSNNTEIIAQDPVKLQFPSGLKVTSFGTELLIGTNSFQRVRTDTLNLTELNFRILQIDLQEISKETDCFASYNYYGHEP